MTCTSWQFKEVSSVLHNEEPSNHWYVQLSRLGALSLPHPLCIPHPSWSSSTAASICVWPVELRWDVPHLTEWNVYRRCYSWQRREAGFRWELNCIPSKVPKFLTEAKILTFLRWIPLMRLSLPFGFFIHIGMFLLVWDSVKKLNDMDFSYMELENYFNDLNTSNDVS